MGLLALWGLAIVDRNDGATEPAPGGRASWVC